MLIALYYFSPCWLHFSKHLVCVVVHMQPRLIRLLGKSIFDEYAGKIYQLKFYEETAFGSAADGPNY